MRASDKEIKEFKQKIIDSPLISDYAKAKSVNLIVAIEDFRKSEDALKDFTEKNKKQ